MSAQDDELVRRYREASEQDDARPGAHVRNAVRAHAQMLATATAPLPALPAPSRTAANQSRWKISALATVAVVGLSGLLMLQFQRGTPEEQEIAYGQRRAEAPARAQPSAAPPRPAPAPATEAPPAAPAAPAVSQGNARDEASPSARPMVQKPAAPGQGRQLAKTAPAPAIQEAESSRAPSTAGVMSGFPASPPLTADQSLVARPAAPAAPSVSSAPSAETRKRSAVQDASPAGEAPSPYAAALAAASAEPARSAAPVQASPAPQAARSLPGGNAASGSLAAAAPRADLGRSTSSLPDDVREAARAGHTLQMESLIGQGAPIDARDNAGRTALMLAAANGQTTAVQKLLALGANPALVDREGLNAAQQARRLGYTRIADLIDAVQ